MEISLKCKDVGIEGNSNRGISLKAKLAMQTNAQNFLWEKLDIYSLTYISIQKVRHLFIKLKQFLLSFYLNKKCITFLINKTKNQILYIYE